MRIYILFLLIQNIVIQIVKLYFFMLEFSPLKKHYSKKRLRGCLNPFNLSNKLTQY